jgi:hypothetical protein
VKDRLNNKLELRLVRKIRPFNKNSCEFFFNSLKLLEITGSIKKKNSANFFLKQIGIIVLLNFKNKQYQEKFARIFLNTAYL